MSVHQKGGAIGPAWLLWGAADHIGPTLGDINYTYGLTIHPVQTDGTGTANVGHVTGGVSDFKVTVPLTLVQLETFGYILGQETDTLENQFYNSVGEETLPLSKELIIKPSINNLPDETTADHLTVFVCSPPIPKFEITWAREGAQRTWMCEMFGYPDTAVGNEGKTFKLGQNVA